MNKKIQRVLSGILATMFVGQIMIYGDGNSQGIAHAETLPPRSRFRRAPSGHSFPQAQQALFENRYAGKVFRSAPDPFPHTAACRCFARQDPARCTFPRHDSAGQRHDCSDRPAPMN